MAQNKVIAGKYAGCSVKRTVLTDGVIIDANVAVGIDKVMARGYELVTEEMRKSATSGVARGAVGAVLLGPVGLLAGLSAKNKGTYTLVVTWRDDEQSLMEVDEKIYKLIVKGMF